MKFNFFEEPDLEFANGGTHIDVRFGITRFGPLDVGETKAPTQLKVGFVGTDETIAALRLWLDRCRRAIPAKDSKLVNLFPEFPGCAPDTAFRSTLVFHDRWCSSIRQREIDAVLTHSDGDETVRQSVAMFVDRAEEVVQQGGPMVLMCVPPHDLLAAVDERRGRPVDTDEQEIDESADPANSHQPPTISFHDLLKAEAMRLSVPIQMVRPKTYQGKQPPRKRGKKTLSLPLQDEATRAWNIHSALYYKAGGIPWRLLRDAAELTTCFIGISFYRTLDKSRLLTSVAQVFNERGEGVIVKGGQAQLDKDDKTPHLSEADAHALLNKAIQVYRQEHRTSPARVVVHKTSRVLPEEAVGFDSAAQEHAIDSVELLTVRRSMTRLFREGTYPPLRGTFVDLQPGSGLLYLKGSVDFFKTYPGMYVPRPLEFTTHRAETPVEQLAREMLSLSKLNWNNTQFDGGEPITVRAARRVGDILKCVAEGGRVQPTFRFFM
ncbi:MAG TPA: hypothetical protein VFY10_12855 [Dehalococcoidia bacterium]|nr:hypothetical protein [Dehalococcoidia bacterium]